MISLKIETLLFGKVVEQNRVEYKAGWNPGETICTICAFANDYSNVNGGYIVIGVAEKDGMPVLPPVGVPKDQLDLIQKQIFEYCNRIEPRYIPAIEVVDYPDEDTHLIYLKCSPGDSGPYQAPVDVYSKAKADRVMKYWIRPASLTVAAKKDEIAELYEKFNSIPFAAGQIRSRKYRNRRIGEMFKEIDLSEKQGTGITKILRTLKANGSPAPGFETVDERVYLSTVIRMHEGFGVVDSQSDPQNDPQKVSQNDLQKKQSFTRMEEAIIQVIQAEPTITRSEIAEKLGVSLKTVARRLKGMTNVQYVGSSKSGHWEID